MKELSTIVEFYAERVEAAIEGKLYNVNGEYEVDPQTVTDEMEQVDLFEYLQAKGLGDIRFEISISGELTGGKTLLAFGGPTVWLHDNKLCGCWGAETKELYFSLDVRNHLFGYFQELYETIRK